MVWTTFIFSFLDLEDLDLDESCLDLSGTVPDTDMEVCPGNESSDNPASTSSLTNCCETSFGNSASSPKSQNKKVIANGHLATSQRDIVIDDILTFAEVSLIKDCLTSKDKITDTNVSKKVAENLSSLDISKFVGTKEFLSQVLFEIDFNAKLEEFDEFCENQIGLESLLDDIVQASKDASAIDGIDCF